MSAARRALFDAVAGALPFADFDEDDARVLASAIADLLEGDSSIDAILQECHPAADTYHVRAAMARLREEDRRVSCAECNGRGVLTQLGGDWGETADRDVRCWACGGSGRLP